MRCFFYFCLLLYCVNALCRASRFVYICLSSINLSIPVICFFCSKISTFSLGRGILMPGSQRSFRIVVSTVFVTRRTSSSPSSRALSLEQHCFASYRPLLNLNCYLYYVGIIYIFNSSHLF